ncbi:MAG TPA: UDP-4-amino-4,6-dideoxy-N-acetyl-beta-L-altrosamine N-acetyltransferase [Dehalococcoidia bacterium]|nr:UDP-4-amino-4,6-dideoxy-N-acetyl-beta-L-altrosamine N-acetyltransferase [Dehalococcoidia bacterium]
MMAGNVTLKLLPLSREYVEFVRQVRNDPRVSEHLFTDTHISKEEQERWYRKQARDKRSFVFIALADRPVGYCQIKNVDYVNLSCEVGFCLAPEYQSKGYGAALVKELIRYARGKLNMHRVYLEVFADNERAIRLYERCGFGKEGLLRHKILKNGEFRDVVVMSVIAD